jgi:hypothetical protein
MPDGETMRQEKTIVFEYYELRILEAGEKEVQPALQRAPVYRNSPRGFSGRENLLLKRERYQACGVKGISISLKVFI